MSLKTAVTADMQAAMRAKASARLNTLRLLLAAMKQREVDERIELSDADVLGILEKLIKQRRESIVQYEKGAREDLAAVERQEIEVLSAYLPQQMSAEEIAAAVVAAIVESGAASAKDMGKVMNALRPKLAGRADMGAVSAQVKAKLGS